MKLVLAGVDAGAHRETQITGLLLLALGIAAIRLGGSMRHHHTDLRLTGSCNA